MVENVFRTMKSGLDTRPVFHRLGRTTWSCFCSFLAILRRLDLEQSWNDNNFDFEWDDILEDLAARNEGLRRQGFAGGGSEGSPAIRFV